METVVEPVLTEIVVTSYEGDLSSSGKYDGVGYAVMDNECIYEGFFKEGLFHGKGRFTWTDRVAYEGDFEYGQLMGKGTYEWADGSTYEGSIKNGKRHGKGIFKCSGGQLYEGDWVEGKRHGMGVMAFNDDKSIAYTGEWAFDKRDGYGLMKYASGNSYEGQWKADKKCGRGTMLWKSSEEVYIGDWQDDKPHGFGEHIWGDGSSSKAVTKQMCNIYRGEWRAGVRHGHGTFFYSNGSQYTGQWSNNYKEGEGIFIHPNGKIFFGEFLKDRIVSPTEALRSTPDITAQMKLNILDIFNQFSALSIDDNLKQTLPAAPAPAISTTATGTHAPTSFAQLGGKANPATNTNPASNNTSRSNTAQGAKRAAAAPAAAMPTPPTLFNTTLSTTASVLQSSEANTKTLQRTALLSGSVAAAQQSAAKATLRCIEAVAASRANAESQTNEIERLLLRYNSQLRSFYKKCTEHVNRRKFGHKEMLMNITDKFSSNWSRVEQTMYSSRDIFKRFMCMPFDQMRKLLREIDIIGPYFTSYDLLCCYRKMLQQHQYVAANLQIEHFRNKNGSAPKTAIGQLSCILDCSFLGDEIVSIASDLPSSRAASSSKSSSRKDRSGAAMAAPKRLGSVLPVGSTHSLDNDSRQPLLERHFGELFVRCVSDYASKRGVDCDGVYYALFRVLAEKFEPFCNDKRNLVSDFNHAFYLDSIQDCLRSFGLHGSVLYRMWNRLVDYSRKANVPEASLEPVIRLKEIVTLFRKLRGTFIKESSSIADILVATGFSRPLPFSTRSSELNNTLFDKTAVDRKANASNNSAEEATTAAEAPTAAEQPPSAPEDIDLSCLSKLLDYEDFTFAICKVLVSDIWVGPSRQAIPVQKSSATLLESTKSTVKSPTEEEEANDESLVMSVKQRLNNTLSSWLQTYETEELPL